MKKEFWVVKGFYSIYQDKHEAIQSFGDYDDAKKYRSALKETYPVVTIDFHMEVDGVSVLPSDQAA